MKKLMTVLLSLVLVGGLFLTASAAPIKGCDKPLGWAVSVPAKGDSRVLVYEDFEGAPNVYELPSDEIDYGYTFYSGFYGTGNDSKEQGFATVKFTKDAAYAGKGSLIVTDRAEGPGCGYNTWGYDPYPADRTKNFGTLITEKYTKGDIKTKQTESIYFSAWVKCINPKDTMQISVFFQYGGTGELWIPGGINAKVDGKTWTQIGGKIVNGKVYYAPFTLQEDDQSGVYALRKATTWVALKGVTKDDDGNNFNTSFYMDNVVIWKENDTKNIISYVDFAKLEASGGSTAKTTASATKSSSGAGSTTVSETVTTVSSDTQTTDSETTVAGDTETTTTKEQAGQTTVPVDNKGEDSSSPLVWIIPLIVIVLGGGGFCLYWFVLRKKKSA